MSLSAQIKTIRREMQPSIRVNGSATSNTSPGVQIHRKYEFYGTTDASTGVLNVKGSTLAGVLPNGCKILGMKVSNLTGRTVRILIAAASPILDSSSVGWAVDKTIAAPLAYFPTLVVQIPDLLAAKIDTGDATNVLFNVYGSASERIRLHFHVLIAV